MFNETCVKYCGLTKTLKPHCADASISVNRPIVVEEYSAFFMTFNVHLILRTIKARPRSAVRASNHAQYAVNRKYGVA